MSDSKKADPRAPKAWAGRFAKAVDPELEKFSASIHFDQRLWRMDLRGSRAHARMLGQQGILSADEVSQLLAGLDQIAAELEAGSFPFDASAEDIHMNVERRLHAIAGSVAGKLHTGRSRNDQVATDFLLYMREAAASVRGALCEVHHPRDDDLLLVEVEPEGPRVEAQDGAQLLRLGAVEGDLEVGGAVVLVPGEPEAEGPFVRRLAPA